MKEQLSRFLAVGLCLPSCVSTPLPPESTPILQKVFEGSPTYPVTKIALPSGMELRHVARKSSVFNRESGDKGPHRPETESAYELRNVEGDIVLTDSSMLTDPDLGSEELRAYHKENDFVTVAVSETGNTILIIEDRSPYYPNRSHFVLQRTTDEKWRSRGISVPMGPEEDKGAEGFVPPTSQYWAKVIGLNDEAVVVSLDGKKSTIRIVGDGPSQPSG
jgi:hypothetical protein